MRWSWLVDDVVAELKPRGRTHVEARQLHDLADARVDTHLRTRVVLLHLRAVLDAVRLEGRCDAVVGEELQVRVDDVRRRLEVPALEAVGVRRDGHEALRASALARVERVPRRRPRTPGTACLPSPHTARAGSTPDMFQVPP